MPNLLSLLNIPDDIDRFGDLRQSWDLDRKAEAFIPLVKKYITNEKKSFTLSAANKFFESQGYQDLLDTMQGLSIDKSLGGLTEKPKSLTRTEPVSPAFGDSKTNNGDCKVKFDPFPSGGPTDDNRFQVPIVSHLEFKKFLKDENRIVPCIVNQKTRDIFVLSRTLDSQKSAFVYNQVELDLNDMDPKFECCFFKVKRGNENSVVSLEELNKYLLADMHCSFLLQHPQWKQYYHVLSMNWKELTPDPYNISVNIPVIFTHPSPVKMFKHVKNFVQ